MTMATYPKLYGPYKRYIEGPNKNKLIIGEWYYDVVRDVANLPWVFTEKIDGTNIRIHWDGHKVEYGGRTDRAILPGQLRLYLEGHFTEELFEQTFQDTEVTLYGEGFGGKIQKMGQFYGPEQRFILFDVKIGHFWMLREHVVGIAASMGIPVVPAPLEGTLQDAIDMVSAGMNSFIVGQRARSSCQKVWSVPCVLVCWTVMPSVSRSR